MQRDSDNLLSSDYTEHLVVSVTHFVCLSVLDLGLPTCDIPSELFSWIFQSKSVSK